MSDNQFKLQINFTKSYRGEDGNAYIEGIASGPEVDLTGERMSTTALESMVSSIKKRLVEFRDAHQDEWNSDLGEIVELSLTPDNHLLYRAKLDLNLSGAQDLWYRVHDLGKKLGVSIGGSVIKAGYEYVSDLGKEVFTYFDVDLFEISITRQAAYQYSFANAVTKSLPKKEEPMSKSEEVEKTDVEETSTTGGGETVTTSTNDTNLTESEAAEQSDAKEEAQATTEATEEESTEGTAEAAEESDAKEETAKETDSEEDVEKNTDAAEGETEDAAEESTEEVAKSTAFGDWAEASMTVHAIESLSWTLQDYIWVALMDDKSAAEKVSTIEAGLTDFHSLVMKVVTAIASDSPSEDVKRAAEAFKASKPETLTKSLTEKDAKVEELTKSLSDKTTELQTVQKSLAEKEAELEKINARKGIVFDKFGKTQVEKTDPKSVQKEAHAKFAGFMTTGVR